MSRHLLRIEGSARPMVMDFDGEGPTSCDACTAAEDRSGRVLHDADCRAARDAVARTQREIASPADAAAAFAEAVSLHLAYEFAASQLGGDVFKDEATATAARYRDLVTGYLAGRQVAEARIRQGAARLARLVADVDGWPSATDDRRRGGSG